MTENSKQFQEFLRDEVNINQSRLDRLHTAVRAVSGYLEENLAGYQKMEPRVVRATDHHQASGRQGRV